MKQIAMASRQGTRSLIAALGIVPLVLASLGCGRPNSTMSSSALNTTVVKTSDQIARKTLNALLNYDRNVLIELGLSEEKAKIAVPSKTGPVVANVEITFETDALVGPDYFRQYDVRYSIGSNPKRARKTVRIWLINKDGAILLSGIQYP